MAGVLPTNATWPPAQDWTRASQTFDALGFDQATARRGPPSKAEAEARKAARAIKAAVEALGVAASKGGAFDSAAAAAAADEGANDPVACLASVPDAHLLDRERRSGLTLLQAAAALGNVAFVEAFLTRAAERGPTALYATDDAGATALHLACYHGRRPAVHALLAPLADDAARMRYLAMATHAKHETALDAAAKQGHTEVAELVLSLLPPDAKAGAADRALTLACRHGRADAARSLLAAASADSARRLSDLLFAACSSGSVETVDAVLAHGSKAGVAPEDLVRQRKPGSADTPAHAAASCSASTAPAVLQLLAERGADLAETNATGESPLLHACRQNCRANAAALVEALGEDTLFAVNFEGESVLAVAAAEGHAGLSEFLADQAPALLTLPDRHGRVPRQRASGSALALSLAEKARRALGVSRSIYASSDRPGLPPGPSAGGATGGVPWSVSQH